MFWGPPLRLQQQAEGTCCVCIHSDRLRLRVGLAGSRSLSVSTAQARAGLALAAGPRGGFPPPTPHPFACISVHCRRDDGHAWKPVRKDLVFQKHPICTSSVLVFQPPKQGSDFIDQFGRASTVAFQGVRPHVLGAMKQRPPRHDPCRVTLFGCHWPSEGATPPGSVPEGHGGSRGSWSCLALTWEAAAPRLLQ